MMADVGRWQIRLMGGLLLLAAVVAWLTWPLTVINAWQRALAIGAVVGLAVVAGIRANPIQRMSRRTFVLSSVALAGLVRAAWASTVTTVPLSDFDVYHRVASTIASGHPVFSETHQPGFPVLLGAAYWLFGPELVVARGLNVLLSVIAVVLLHRVGEDLIGPQASRVTVLLFAIWPAQTMLTSVPATETPFVVLLLFGIVVFLSGVRQARLSVPLLAIAGGVLGVSSLVRSVSLVVVAIMALWLLAGGRASVRRRLTAASVLAAAFFAVTLLYRLVAGPPPPLAATPLYLASQVLTGTNVAAGGDWSPEDAALFGRIVRDKGPQSAVPLLYEVAWERIRSDPAAFGALVVSKAKRMWTEDLYGAYWSTATIDGGETARHLQRHSITLFVLSQVFYCALLLLAAIGCARLAPGRIPFGLNVLVTVVLVFVALHSVIEAQSRFHHPWVLVFLLLAGYGATRGESRIAEEETLA
jgi:hypothetical protein